MLEKTALAILLVVATCVISSAQQEESKRPSPAALAQCKFSDGKTITVDYSRPRMRGRKIFGGLVPYGEVWRTGANEATTFVTNENLLMVKGSNVPAGSYTIFTVPDPDKWTLKSTNTPASRVPLTSMNLRSWPACPCRLRNSPRPSKTLRFHLITPAEAARCA